MKHRTYTRRLTWSRAGLSVVLIWLGVGCSAVTIATRPRPKPVEPAKSEAATAEASAPVDQQTALLKAQMEMLKDAQEDAQIATLTAQMRGEGILQTALLQAQIDEIQERRDARHGFVRAKPKAPLAALTSDPDYDKSQWFLFWGLVGSPQINVDTVCRNKTVAQLQTISTPANLLVSVITAGLLNPKTARVWCGD